MAAGGTADAVARRVEIIEGRWLLLGAGGAAASLTLERDGAVPLDVPLRATAERAGEREGEVALADLAAPGPGVWRVAAGPSPVTLAAAGIVAGPGEVLRVRAHAAAGGPLTIAVEPLPPHAEARRVRVEEGELLVEGDAPGEAEEPAVARAAPGDAPGHAAGSPEPRLVARHRGDGAEVGASVRARRRPLQRAARARAARARRRLGPVARRPARRHTSRRHAGQEGRRRVPGASRRRARAAAVLHGRGQPLDPRRGAARRARRPSRWSPAPSRAAGGCSAASPSRCTAPRWRSPRRFPDPARSTARRRAGPDPAAARVRPRRHRAHELQPRRGARRRPRRRADQPDPAPRGAVLPVPGRRDALRRRRPARQGAPRRAARTAAERADPPGGLRLSRTRACARTSRCCAACAR